MPIHIHIHTRDADQWITVHPSGTHVLIGENGEIKAGMGGKFNGKSMSSVGKKSSTPPPAGPNTESAKPKPSSKPEKLTANEKSALSSYSGDDFLRINTELRSGKDSDPAVKRIDSAIEKSPLPAGQTLYRGMSREAAKQLFAGGNITKGMEIYDPAFSSTSKSPGVAKMIGMGGVLLKIETGSGAKGLDMSPHSRNAHEQEVLLPRNAKMRVVGLTAPKSPTDPVIVRVAYGD
jgi:hypothetical protein